MLRKQRQQRDNKRAARQHGARDQPALPPALSTVAAAVTLRIEARQEKYGGATERNRGKLIECFQRPLPPRPGAGEPGGGDQTPSFSRARWMPPR